MRRKLPAFALSVMLVVATAAYSKDDKADDHTPTGAMAVTVVPATSLQFCNPAA